MKTSYAIGTLAALFGICLVGPTWAGVGAKGRHDGGRTVWVESIKNLQVDAAGIESLSVKTHNGGINYDGDAGNAAQIEMTVTVRGGGPDEATAEAALAAIDVFAGTTDNHTAEIGWRWSVEKEKHWRSHVSFDVQGPAAIDLHANTHNGAVNAQGLQGAAKLRSHNGEITVDAAGHALDAELYNGQINARFNGDTVRLKTHNGLIAADLSGCGTVTGRMVTHNGEVVVKVGEATAAEVTCTTHNGAISHDVPLTNMSKSRRKLTGTIGGGGGSLAIKTHNGPVRIKGTETGA